MGSNTRSNVHQQELSGIWRSEYTYRSSGRGKELSAVHYIRLYPRKNGVVFETVPDVNESYMIGRFSLDDRVLTGTWQEGTAPGGEYKGALYHGAGQLILSEGRKEMKGMWVGFGRNMEVKAGPWVCTYMGADESALKGLAKAPGQ